MNRIDPQATADRGACQPLSAEALVEALAATMEQLLAAGASNQRAVLVMTRDGRIHADGDATAKELVDGVVGSILEPHPVRRLKCYREALAAARRVIEARGGQ